MSLKALVPLAKFVFDFLTSRNSRTPGRDMGASTVLINRSPGCQVTVINHILVAPSWSPDMPEIKCSKCQMPLPLDRNIYVLPEYDITCQACGQRSFGTLHLLPVAPPKPLPVGQD
jgi:hypothetical protein